MFGEATVTGGERSCFSSLLQNWVSSSLQVRSTLLEIVSPALTPFSLYFLSVSLFAFCRLFSLASFSASYPFWLRVPFPPPFAVLCTFRGSIVHVLARTPPLCTTKWFDASRIFKRDCRIFRVDGDRDCVCGERALEDVPLRLLFVLFSLLCFSFRSFSFRLRGRLKGRQLYSL